jgi:hypothetical protein
MSADPVPAIIPEQQVPQEVVETTKKVGSFDPTFFFICKKISISKKL